MKKNIKILVLLAMLFADTALAKQAKGIQPGLVPFTPTRIEWLTTVLQASLRVDLTEENKFLLQIANPDSQTILIYVRYLPDVNREVMNMTIESSREVIKITAKSYGWDNWVKAREDIQRGAPSAAR